jgi:hypothetical protein
MIKFFRKIRQKMLTENKFSKYLLYAIGEIILVVIGILIALYINNWNQNRNEITKLNSILNIVKTDLVRDTLNIAFPIELYEDKETQILNILENKRSYSLLDSITELNYMDHFSTTRLVTEYDFFSKQNKGIELLKNIANNLDIEKDTLITSLIDKHSKYKLYFDEDNAVIRQLNLQNVENFEELSWFTDWLLKKYNNDMFQYFYSDEFKRVAGRYSLYSKQFLKDLEEYDNFAKTYITLIETRLKK